MFWLQKMFAVFVLPGRRHAAVARTENIAHLEKNIENKINENKNGWTPPLDILKICNPHRRQLIILNPAKDSLCIEAFTTLPEQLCALAPLPPSDDIVSSRDGRLQLAASHQQKYII